MTEQHVGNRSEALEPFEDFVRRHVGPSDERAGGDAQGPRLRDARRPRRRRRAGQRAQPRYAATSPPPSPNTRCSTSSAAWPAENTIAEPMIGLGYSGTVTPGVIRRNVLESPAWYTAYTPVPARDQPGPARSPPQLPDDGDRPHRARHGERLAARREHRGGRGRHADAPPRHQRVDPGHRRRRLPAPDHRRAGDAARAPGNRRSTWSTWTPVPQPATTSAWCSSIPGCLGVASVTSRH